MNTEKILAYEHRENLKKEGWKIFHESPTVHGKATGILRVIDAHYWRQRECLEGDRSMKKKTKLVVGKKYSPGYILDIDHYTPHWLYSMRHIIPKEVMECLKENWGYEPVECKYLKDGNTLYQFEFHEYVS